ncbi:Na+/H+ antiporter [Sphingobium sp. CAP-1]|uniref:Na+/H+ antiporter n=1 Tax=Sphingobium sp. CAP-1 TaxID=2676077 RepID=UPI0012BB2F42|nr:Na+/H+ antiporter [Sphingobium sp. CAP-1]QGP79691.1 Na+/H+ antiporter [Sphingobium sp. CAP-1]
MNSMQMFELVIAMLLAIILLHYAARALGLPPAVALLTGGALFAFLPGLPVISLDPELVLVIFLPPLLMDGAWFIALRHLHRHMLGIIALAVGAVIFTTTAIALVAHMLVPSLPWAACAALGAIVAPPDAVSARAVLQNVHLPRRLSILLEGESLFNDASGLVLFRFAVAAGMTGAFSLVDAVQSFALLAIGGALVGAAVGAAWVVLAPKLNDNYLMIASSLLAPWASYLLAESGHLSGVIATVTTGLICGWYQHVVFTATVRMNGTAFWAVMIFLMEAFVFLLIGSSLRGVIDRVGGFHVVLAEMAGPVLAILAALTAVRFIWVFGSDAMIRLLRGLGLRRYTPIGARAATVLGWAGMRGVVTLAVALSVPENFPGRDFILVTAFAVIIGTVLIQGTTLGAVIRLVKLEEPESDRARMTMSEAEAAMARAQLIIVERHAYDVDGTLLHPRLLDRYTRHASIATAYAGQEADFADRLHAHFDLILQAVAAGRAELLRLHRNGDIDEETLHELERDLDIEELGALAAKA